MNRVQSNTLQYLEQKKDDAATQEPLDTEPIISSSQDASPQHTYDYTYLHDNPLSQVFDFCVPDHVGNVAIPVYVCIYSIVRKCSIELEENGEMQHVAMPFLKFLMEHKSNEITFPSFEYICDNSSSETNETLFRNMCLMRVLEIAGEKEQMNESASKFTPIYDNAFKGMLYHDNAVLVMFDYDALQTHFVQPEQQSWAIVDEIVFNASVAGVPVDSRVVSIFRKNKLLWNIGYSGGYVEFPHVLYSVVNVSNSSTPSWKNEMTRTTPGSPEEAAFRKSSLMIGQKTDDYVCGSVDGSKYGDRYLFSVYPIVAETLPQCKRYAVFVVGANYVLDKTFHAEYMAKRSVPTNPTRIDGDDAATLGDSATLGVGDSDNADTLYELIPAIYFVETTAAATLMWGVRSYSQFTAI